MTPLNEKVIVEEKVCLYAERMRDRVRMRELERIASHEQTIGDVVEYSKLFHKLNSITIK